MKQGWPEVVFGTHATSQVPNSLYYLLRTTEGVKYTTARPDLNFLDTAQL